MALLLTLGCGSVAAAAGAPPRITFYFGLKRPEARAQAAFFAVQQPGSPTYRHFSSARQPCTFWDVVSGNNQYLRKVPGFQAKPGYDLASGLGVPQFAALAAALPEPAS